MIGNWTPCVVYAFVSVFAANAQFVQQGGKLVGVGAAGSSVRQGWSVALSWDGNTAIVGGPGDNGSVGAVWVFTRSNGVWIQQGSKLVASGGLAFPSQGTAVAISADGNTAIVGGPADNNNVGAAWVFASSGGMWSQQGQKLVGGGAVGQAQFGCSVALSADGNTAIVGGFQDNFPAGAAWVYTRTAEVWNQQGSKLVGTDAVGGSAQGFSVAISADGDTTLIGGWSDNRDSGAAWVFTRVGGVWAQQGGKLVGADATVGSAVDQGRSVALSADGNTAIIGGPGDGNFAGTGAAWVFTRSDGVWTQQGGKLVGMASGAISLAQQGMSVALSADGNTAILGAPFDSTTPSASIGAAWVFTRSGGRWTQHGGKLVGLGASGSASQGQAVALSADGTTVLVGGPLDNNRTGAVWAFVKASSPRPIFRRSRLRAESHAGDDKGNVP